MILVTLVQRIETELSRGFCEIVHNILDMLHFIV